MALVARPLPTAIADLDAALRRLKDLVDPAFGLVGLKSESNDDNAQTPRDDITEKRHRAATKIRIHLNNLDVFLTFLQVTTDVKWHRLAPEKLHGISIRTVAAVVGAGAEAVDALERSLRRLGELYALEADLVRIHVDQGDGEMPDIWDKVVEEERYKLRRERHEVRAVVGDMIRGVDCFKTELGRLRLALETFSEEAEYAMAGVELSAAEMLARDSDLSRDIRRLYPDLGPGLALDSSDLQTSSVEQDTNQSSMLTSRQNGSIVFLDDAEDSDSNSEPGPPTPTSSTSSSSSIGFFPAPKSKPQLNINTDMPPRVCRHPPPQTLADIADPEDLLVPIPRRLVTDGASSAPSTDEPSIHPSQQILTEEGMSALELITISPSGLNISPLPPDLSTNPPPTYLPNPTTSTSSPNAAPLPADSIFHLPDITESDILSFFRRAVSVSRFASELPCWSESDSAPGSSESGRNPRKGSEHDRAVQRARLRDLSPKELRDLCSDVYDALVARNVEDQGRLNKPAAFAAAAAGHPGTTASA
ncbi:hypothetical protein VTJ49DRAFT_937 [Mycothermus thermophilus]|uniref:Uncharacterized protein n=1 Tax=Humicola insolens TaxID=85995 RepID=A0ABR3VDW7_HUMIN